MKDIASHCRGQGQKSVVVYDKNAMLEFHYDEQGRGKKGRQHNDRYQRVPEPSDEHFRIDFQPMESAAVPSLAETPSEPTVSASDAAQLVWSSATTNKL